MEPVERRTLRDFIWRVTAGSVSGTVIEPRGEERLLRAQSVEMTPQPLRQPELLRLPGRVQAVGAVVMGPL